MRISRLHAPVTVLGHGRRVGIWVQGCTLACPGCASRDTWDAEGGREVAVDELLTTVLELGVEADGLTISGGEPLQQPTELADLLRGVRASNTARERGWDILMFTGLEVAEWDDHQRAAADLVDAVVAGRYRTAEPGADMLRASGNQELRLLSPLGRERYARGGPLSQELQVVLDEHGLTMIGLPRPGDLGRMERRLRQRGMMLSGVSWRS